MGPQDKLKDWLAQSGLKKTDLARELGVHVSFIHQVLAGQKRPSLENIVRLEQITGGAVTHLDFLNKTGEAA